MAGAPQFTNAQPRSVTRGDRGTPVTEVEAPDQFAANGLHELAVVEEDWSYTGRRKNQRDQVRAIVIEAILGLPEQARDQGEAILITGAEEPAAIGVLREGPACRGATIRRYEVDLAEARLTVTARDVDQKLSGRPRNPANATAGRPGIIKLLLADPSEGTLISPLMPLQS